MISIGIAGSKGRMSTIIADLINKNKKYVIKGLYEPFSEIKEQDFLKNSNGEVIPHSKSIKCLSKCSIIIDFSHATITNELIDIISDLDGKLIIGTTGINENTLNILKKISKEKVVFYSPNMSYGINFLYKYLPALLKNLNDFDKEIIEYHHNKKKDAPSGTAKKFIEILKQSQELQEVYDRTKKDSIRNGDELGVSTIRAGGFAGTHTLLFSNEYESIEITHTAFNRSVFGYGVMKAIEFIESKDIGYFTFTDLLED